MTGRSHPCAKSTSSCAGATSWRWSLPASPWAATSGRTRVITSHENGAIKTTRIDLGKAQIVYSDGQGEMKIDSADGKKMLIAKDPQGRLLFSGPITSKEELDKVPAEVRQRYEKLEQKDLPAVAPKVTMDNEEDDHDMDVDEDDGDNDDDSDNAAAKFSISAARHQHSVDLTTVFRAKRLGVRCVSHRFQHARSISNDHHIPFGRA